jgi:anti-sigma regulatory factor (Ser/Thr protein kinase)
MTSGEQKRPQPSEPAGADAGDVHPVEGSAAVGPPAVSNPPAVADPPDVADPAAVIEPAAADATPPSRFLAPPSPALVDDQELQSGMNVERAGPPGTFGSQLDLTGPGSPPIGDPLVPSAAVAAAEAFGQREPLALRVAAQPRELSAIRRAMREWLAEAGVPTVVAEDVVLACGEAAANVIEHAYGGSGEGWMEIKVVLVNGTLVASVGDHGRWQPHGSGEGRGRGIRLIGVLMDQVDLHSDDSGTKVTMRKALDDPGA